MTQSKAEPRAATGCLGLVFMVGCIGTALYFGTDLLRRPASAPPAALTAHSSLLGIDLPEAQATDEAALLDGGADLAQRLGFTCTSSREAFLFRNELTAMDGVNRGMTDAGFSSYTIQNTPEATAFKASGPRDLFGVMMDSGLFLCEY